MSPWPTCSVLQWRPTNCRTSVGERVRTKRAYLRRVVASVVLHAWGCARGTQAGGGLPCAVFGSPRDLSFDVGYAFSMIFEWFERRDFKKQSLNTKNISYLLFSNLRIYILVEISILVIKILIIWWEYKTPFKLWSMRFQNIRSYRQTANEVSTIY